METLIKQAEIPLLLNRDLSWLSFNARVLAEAAASATPLLERIKFLSIYSSNLDEFYRVRYPVLKALKKLHKKTHDEHEKHVLEEANQTIDRQQQQYGRILKETVLPALSSNSIDFSYGQPFPPALGAELTHYFMTQLLGFLRPIALGTPEASYFPENNLLYFLVELNDQGNSQHFIVNIPSEQVPRFYLTKYEERSKVFFIDDIIQENLAVLFPQGTITNCHSFKITRDAELELDDEYSIDMADQLEKQLLKRDQGLATRLLYSPGMSADVLDLLVQRLNVAHATIVSGGRYHNLKDLADFPIKDPKLSHKNWPKIPYPILPKGETLHQFILAQDILINPPYQSYDSVLQFFNEAATDATTTEIATTLYRVAKDSKIVNALITAAKNGKKVTVLVELKARFDENNNIKWAKKMKTAGVAIIYSVTALKVHAKVALVKRKIGLRTQYTGLLATGNFNETTANFYTDHILMTANPDLLRELELLFIFLAKRKKPSEHPPINFQKLLVAQFNLQQAFLDLIQREIQHAQSGKKAHVIIKLNNLEEEVMIRQLYKAAAAGVKIELIIRGICRLVPTTNIIVRRIVDRYLEHGRLFWFYNDGNEALYLGSADWMTRNIYRRIEVCFPIYNNQIKKQLKDLLNIQLADNVQATYLNQQFQNIPVENAGTPIQSQKAIYEYLNQNHLQTT
ncbi:MAG: polyphosphate kinase 1 [Pedobacter sp.]|uniref:polyphosphate kinase 1 n=1 Tax=Pedobacter sp. TaxID=1411316 RepID=UPI0028071DC5|nr:polyphosphate kinase 1 [Pedobacter sp.]MDQ8006473.1 polyphosphate kinase 1 [Pedobacter sp.]